MKCALKGIAAFLVCAALAALFLPSVRAGGAYEDKQVLVKVRVVDTDEHKPVPDATVTFFRDRRVSFDDAEQTLNAEIEQESQSAVTDENGYAEVIGTFSGRANKGPDILGNQQRWYVLGGTWLKIVASGRPIGIVAIYGHCFGGERDYDDDTPLEVLVVMNKTPAL